MEEVPNKTQATEGTVERTSVKRKRGGTNLLLLGIVASVIAMITTGISLVIYHNSGDIYLDRSRPGYLPDEAEIEQEENKEAEEYTFSRNGAIDIDVLEEYVEKIQIEIQAIDKYKTPFNPDVLSEEHLGISGAGTEE